MPSANSNHHFPSRLHDVLDDAEKKGHSHIISWCPTGTSFRIHDTNAIMGVLPKYFRQTKYKSLLRQLQGYGFTRVTSGEGKGRVSHPMFIRGRRSLCTEMKRKTPNSKPDSTTSTCVSNNTTSTHTKKRVNSSRKSQDSAIRSGVVGAPSAVPSRVVSSSSSSSFPKPSITRSLGDNIQALESNFKNSYENVQALESNFKRSLIKAARGQQEQQHKMTTIVALGDNSNHRSRKSTGMDALRVEIGCTFSSPPPPKTHTNKRRSMKAPNSLNCFKKRNSATQQQLRRSQQFMVQNSASAPVLLESERLAKRQRSSYGCSSNDQQHWGHNSLNDFSSSGMFKNASFPFSASGQRPSGEDAILKEEKLQFEKSQRDNFDQLEKLCFPNVHKAMACGDGNNPFVQSLQHSDSTMGGATLDLDISLTTTTTTTHHDGKTDPQVSSSTIFNKFVLPTSLEPTPIMSPKRENNTRQQNEIIFNCNIEFPQKAPTTKEFNDKVAFPSEENNSMVGSEVSDEIDEGIAEAFGVNDNENGWSQSADVTEQDDDDDWTKGIVYEGKTDCVLEPEKFQIEVQSMLSNGKPTQKQPQPQLMARISQQVPGGARQFQPSQQQQQQHLAMLERQAMKQIMMKQAAGANPLLQNFSQLKGVAPSTQTGMSLPYPILSRSMPLQRYQIPTQIQQLKR